LRKGKRACLWNGGWEKIGDWDGRVTNDCVEPALPTRIEEGWRVIQMGMRPSIFGCPWWCSLKLLA
jgi:hypothetical protein